MTLGYPESGHQLRKLRYLVLHAGSAGPPQKPHNFATRQRIPTGSPRTKRHTPVHLLRVLKHGEQPFSSVDARELGCRSLLQVSALGMTVLLKSHMCPGGDVARARKSGNGAARCRAGVAAAWWCWRRISLLAGARETEAGCPFPKPALPWHPSPLKSLAPGS